MANGFRVLAKSRNEPHRVALGVQEVTTDFTVEPLFQSIGREKGPAAAATSSWRVLSFKDTVEAPNPWQACHQLVAASKGTDAEIEFAEPDLEQAWVLPRDDTRGLSIAGNCAAADPQSKDYPRDANNYWYRDANHGQYDKALKGLSDPGAGNRVRIAHLDTGYDPSHGTRPAFIAKQLERNFVDADRPGDASDSSSGVFTNLGHGTGTLSLLAGKALNGGAPIGIAPFAEIVPIRVANSVVLFRNSAIAKAFDYVHGLGADAGKKVHVITMSMGGVASQAWVEAINALYDAGVFIVTAAGNNYDNLPVHEIVYPARFDRVVAACGVMADGQPYADLSPLLMAGNYGPPEKMATAIAAYTPNTPWARLGCPSIIDFDGNGTSAATPQVAGAAALWIQKNRKAYDAYSAPWMRVEAVRKALFDAARYDSALRDHLGRGRLAAADALAIAPPKEKELQQLPPDRVNFPFLKLLTGLGLDSMPPGQRNMIELEALQILQSTRLPDELRAALRTGAAPSARIVARAADELLAKPGMSAPLRSALEGVAIAGAPTGVNSSEMKPKRMIDPVARLHLDLACKPNVSKPPTRRLRVFAFDPAASVDPDTASMNLATVSIRWEDNLQPGPVGDYVEVIDVDPASACCYAPVDLNHPYLIAQNGLAPSESNPQFHQQMAYAVSMRTIEIFERALGRCALWSSRLVRNQAGDVVREEFVERLRIYPHALRAANSFYSGDRKALLLGYFSAGTNRVGLTMPGGRVFCALSHDIVAHETSHALLDGLHRRYQEATNPDMLAFHEAFADIVALFQHFMIPEALLDQIKKARGDLEAESLLGQLAVQFGQASQDGYGALRNAIGTFNKEGEWERCKPQRSDYDPSKEPHALGAVLVSAVFDAFIKLYRQRSADLIRLATSGSGVLPAGDISQDLATRLAKEAGKLAGHVLNMCIRALDYCPPVDLTFGDYLRALITADRDLVQDDDRGYRVAFIAAFRDRGIYPSNVPSLSVDSAVWEKPPLPLSDLGSLFKTLRLDWALDTDRRTAYETSRLNAIAVRKWLLDPNRSQELAALGFEPAAKTKEILKLTGEMRPIEVHSVRPAHRVGPDGQSRTSLVIEITQTFREGPQRRRYRNGCTLIIELSTAQAGYFVRKKMKTVIERELLHRAALANVNDGTLNSNYFATAPGTNEPFALLHRSH